MELRVRVKAVGFGLSDLKRAIKSGYITGLVESDTLQLILASMQLELGGVQPVAVVKAPKRRDVRAVQADDGRARTAGGSAEGRDLLRDVQASLEANGTCRAPAELESAAADNTVQGVAHLPDSMRAAEHLEQDPAAKLVAALAALPTTAGTPKAEALAALTAMIGLALGNKAWRDGLPGPV